MEAKITRAVPVITKERFMTIKKEDVVAKAKELGIEITDAQVDAHVLIGELPVKKTTGAPPEDKGEEEEDEDLTEGMRRRLRKEKEKRNIVKTEHDKLAKELADLKVAEAARQVEKDKEKGNWEKLNKDAQDAAARAGDVIKKTKDKFRDNAVRTAVEGALLAAGVPGARLSKAVRLFDLSKVEFSWTKEDDLEYEIEDFAVKVESFKKENDFLFEDKDEDDDPPRGYQGNRPPKPGARTTDEKKREEIKKRFSQVFNN
jgi:hypothetical protein